MLLYDAKLNLAKLLMRVKRGTATKDSASPGELTDTNRNEPSDYYFRSLSNGGVLFFPGTSQSREIIGYDGDTGDFVFYPADITPNEDDVYFASPVDWDNYELVQAINLALEDLGQQSGIRKDDDSLVIVSRQGTYTLPSDVSNIKRVELILDEDNPDLYTTRHLFWDEVDGELRLDPGSEPYWGDVIKLTYCAPHDEVADDDDEVSPSINPMLLKWTAAVFANENIDKNEQVLAKINRAIKTAEAYKTRHPVGMQRDPHLSYYPDSGY